MKVLGKGWQEGDPVPVAGWRLMGSITAVFSLVAGSFMSLGFYSMRGWIALPLYYLHREWVVYHGDIAWTLGFAAGVAMVLFGKGRWKRGSPPKIREEKDPVVEKVPLVSLDAVVKRTLVGTLVGLLVGLFLALVLEMMFFSASLCPVGPPSWKAAVKTEYRRERRSVNERVETKMVMSSSHPLFKYLFVVPVCASTVVGGGIGGVTGMRSWLRR
ncbi:MAG: hypothetical protein ABGX05_19960 [Pirellulaceae bacterium]